MSLAAAPAVEALITPTEPPTEVVAAVGAETAEEQNCYVMTHHLSCGGTKKSQWCDGGYHPSLGDWLEGLDDHFCRN